MNNFTLTNRVLGLTVTVQAKDIFRAKCAASRAYRESYPDVKGSPNSPFHWSVA